VIISPGDDALFALWMWRNKPKMDPTCVVRCKQDWEWFHEFHNVYFIVIEYDLILKLHELIIPDTHFTVSTSSCYQSKIMTVVSTNDVLLVAHCFLPHNVC
jgi:hypothetical protein